MHLKILLLGASGRLGQKIAQKLSEKNIEFVSVTREQTASLDAFQTFLHSVRLGTKKYVLLLDVSLATVTTHIVKFLLAIENKTLDGMIIGTTGHSPEAHQVFAELSERLPICIAPNFSKGIYLLGQLLRTHITPNQNLASLAQSNRFDISLKDTHHQHKKDAPSGTALWLNQWLNLPVESIESVRTGEVIGEHSICFDAPSERIEINHKVVSRDVFAEGACDLSIHFFKKNPSSGIYSVSDIWTS